MKNHQHRWSCSLFARKRSFHAEYRCRGNLAQIGQSRPDSGVGLNHFQYASHSNILSCSLFAWKRRTHPQTSCYARERQFFIDNPLVRIHFVIVMIRWTGLAPWEFEYSGDLNATFRPASFYHFPPESAPFRESAHK